MKVKTTLHQIKLQMVLIKPEDQINPTVISAKKIEAKKIEIKMSESVVNINATGSDFKLLGGY